MNSNSLLCSVHNMLLFTGMVSGRIYASVQEKDDLGHNNSQRVTLKYCYVISTKFYVLKSSYNNSSYTLEIFPMKTAGFLREVILHVPLKQCLKPRVSSGTKQSGVRCKKTKWNNYRHYVLGGKRKGTARKSGLAVRTESQVNQKSYAESKRHLYKNSSAAVCSQSEMEPRPKTPNLREQPTGILLCSPRPDSAYRKMIVQYAKSSLIFFMPLIYSTK